VQLDGRMGRRQKDFGTVGSNSLRQVAEIYLDSFGLKARRIFSGMSFRCMIAVETSFQNRGIEARSSRCSECDAHIRTDTGELSRMGGFPPLSVCNGAPVCTRIERTKEIVQEALRSIAENAGPDNADLSVVFGSVSPSSYTINTVYLWTGGPGEAVLRVALRKESEPRVEALKRRLRGELPKRVGERFRTILADAGRQPERVAAGVAQLRFGFEPADIVNEVMSFGSPTPFEVAINGSNFLPSRAFAAKVH
jgi:hypothetical protein